MSENTLKAFRDLLAHSSTPPSDLTSELLAAFRSKPKRDSLLEAIRRKRMSRERVKNLFEEILDLRRKEDERETLEMLRKGVNMGGNPDTAVEALRQLLIKHRA